jgi:20S proteasome alpha/beta subunit
MRLPDQHVICIMTASASRKLQQRLIQTSPDTVVCLSGIVSDCVALLRKVYEDQDENRRLYGTSGGGLQVVQTISRACQQHSFGGGIRPYGATVVVVSKERIWQTHPSGAVREVTDHIHVLGGTPSQQEELKQQLISSKRTDSTLSEVLEMGARLLSQQMSKTSKTSLPWLEAMLVSPEKGIYRLNQEQIEALIQKVGNQANQRE